jgi:hypothetical protein
VVFHLCFGPHLDRLLFSHDMLVGLQRLSLC